jgi:hypothetical protein
MMSNNIYSTLNQQAVILAVQAIQHDDLNMLTQFGLSELDDELAQQLKHLNIDHLSAIIDFRGSLLQLKFDPRQLRVCINMALEKTREDDQINKAIRAGMRQPILEELKGTTRREFTARRERMGLPEHCKGRIENLSEADELLVLRSWATLKQFNDPLTRLLALYDETHISLDRAWIAIQQAA